MVFSSLLFMFRFLPIVLILYFLAPKKLKNGILFLASLVFYAWGEPVYVLLMLFSTVVDYFHGYMTARFKEQGKMGLAKLMVLFSMIVNLGLLGFFKYSDFLIGNVNQLFGTALPYLNLALPIGISFYTFQTMSYTIDIYRGDAPVQKNIISFGAYVALFPQLIAGPIVRYSTIAEQLNHRRESVDGFSDGIMRFTAGLGKKVLLANNIGLLWELIRDMPLDGLPVLTAWLGALAFAFQIYFDFSGYSDMAIGLGRMFGFHFLENFNYPYESKSITEFWRRWHISLGTWFREYVYIPLGGNRKGMAKQIRNIMAVWLLTGFWHGASWNFVLWGLYFGIILMAEKMFLLRILNRLPAWLQRVYTLVLVLVSWVIFAHDSVMQGLSYLKVMFGMGNTAFMNQETMYLLINYGIMLVLLMLAATHFPKKWAELMLKKPELREISAVCFVLAVLLISTAYLVDASYNPFLYFRF